jgi:hypothetical protein
MSSHHPDPHASEPTPHGASSPSDPGAEHDPALADPHGQPGEPPVDVEAARPPLATLIWPLIILLIVALLVLPQAAQAFARYGNAPIAETATNTGQEQTPVGAETPVVVTTPSPMPPSTQTSGGFGEGTVIPQPTNALTAQPTNVQGPLTTPTAPPATETAPPPTPAPTQAAVPVVSNPQEAVLQSVAIAGQIYRVEPTEIVADWKFSDQPGVASWISGTVINYIVGLPYSATNAALFQKTKQADSIRLTVANGQVLTFRVAAIQRVATTDTQVMAQDHPGVTLLLLGEPTPDRLAILGDYVPQG